MRKTAYFSVIRCFPQLGFPQAVLNQFTPYELLCLDGGRGHSIYPELISIWTEGLGRFKEFFSFVHLALFKNSDKFRPDWASWVTYHWPGSCWLSYPPTQDNFYLCTPPTNSWTPSTPCENNTDGFLYYVLVYDAFSLRIFLAALLVALTPLPHYDTTW